MANLRARADQRKHRRGRVHHTYTFGVDAKEITIKAPTAQEAELKLHKKYGPIRRNK